MKKIKKSFKKCWLLIFCVSFSLWCNKHKLNYCVNSKKVVDCCSNVKANNNLVNIVNVDDETKKRLPWTENLVVMLTDNDDASTVHEFNKKLQIFGVPTNNKELDLADCWFEDYGVLSAANSQIIFNENDKSYTVLFSPSVWIRNYKKNESKKIVNNEIEIEKRHNVIKCRLYFKNVGAKNSNSQDSNKSECVEFSLDNSNLTKPSLLKNMLNLKTSSLQIEGKKHRIEFSGFPECVNEIKLGSLSNVKNVNGELKEEFICNNKLIQRGLDGKFSLDVEYENEVDLFDFGYFKDEFGFEYVFSKRGFGDIEL